MHTGMQKAIKLVGLSAKKPGVTLIGIFLKLKKIKSPRRTQVALLKYQPPSTTPELVTI